MLTSAIWNIIDPCIQVACHWIGVLFICSSSNVSGVAFSVAVEDQRTPQKSKIKERKSQRGVERKTLATIAATRSTCRAGFAPLLFVFFVVSPLFSSNHDSLLDHRERAQTFFSCRIDRVAQRGGDKRDDRFAHAAGLL